MQFKLLAVSLLAGLSAAATVLDVVQRIPDCALLCYNKATQDRGCKPTDFQCVCSGGKLPGIITASTVSCNACSILTSAETGAVLGELCASFANRPTETDVLNASSVLINEILAISATAKSDAMAAAAAPVVHGVLGAAAAGLAALVL